MSVDYRRATLADVPAMVGFVDLFLAARRKDPTGKRIGRDCFVPRGRYPQYVNTYTTWLALLDNTIVGWAVVTHKGVLIHLLVHPDHRGQGIGSQLLSLSAPTEIRSKSDQSTGNPKAFYLKHGYYHNRSEIPCFHMLNAAKKRQKKYTIDVLKKTSKTS
jgi:GNAT superfamily N-acetyltransferase